jgi:hypothetical protein
MEEARESSIKSLLDSAEDYIRTSYDLYKLKAIDKATESAAIVVSRAVAFFVLFMFVLMISIAAALWIGTILSNSWLGFTIVAGFYMLVGIVLYFFTHNWLRKKIGDAIVKQAFK